MQRNLSRFDLRFLVDAFSLRQRSKGEKERGKKSCAAIHYIIHMWTKRFWKRNLAFEQHMCSGRACRNAPFILLLLLLRARPLPKKKRENGAHKLMMTSLFCVLPFEEVEASTMWEWIQLLAKTIKGGLMNIRAEVNAQCVTDMLFSYPPERLQRAIIFITKGAKEERPIFNRRWINFASLPLLPRNC